MAKLRSRAHIHVNRFISLSLPLDEIFDGARAVVRRALAAVAHPGRDRWTKARIAPDIVDLAVAEEHEKKLADAEKSLVGLGFKKAEARAAIDSIRPATLGKPSYEIVAAALQATRPPVETVIASASQPAAARGAPVPDGER